MRIFAIAIFAVSAPASASIINLQCIAQHDVPVSGKKGKVTMGKSSYPISYTVDVARRSVTYATKLGTGTTTDGDANGNVSKASIKIDANGLEMLTYNNLLVGGFTRTGKLTFSADWTKGVSESSTFQNGQFLDSKTITLSCTPENLQD